MTPNLALAEAPPQTAIRHNPQMILNILAIILGNTGLVSFPASLLGKVEGMCVVITPPDAAGSMGVFVTTKEKAQMMAMVDAPPRKEMN